MTKELRKFLTGPLLPVTALALAFVLSLLLFAVFSPEKDGRIFFFPDNTGTGSGSERRGIPARQQKSEQIAVFLEELFLGPETLGLSFAAPKGTVVRHVAVIDKKAIVDLSSDIIRSDSTFALKFVDIIENLRHNVLFNFPKIEEVVFTIEGQQVGVPLYRESTEAL